MTCVLIEFWPQRRNAARKSRFVVTNGQRSIIIQFSLRMANQAGLDAVAEDALFLGGQLLVGGSSFMYLKSLHEAGPQHVVIHQQNKGLHPIFQRVNKKTCGYVMLYMTLQAVGFQAYTGIVPLSLSLRPNTHFHLFTFIYPAYRRGQQSRLHRILSGREPVSLSPHRSLRLRLMNTAGAVIK